MNAKKAVAPAKPKASVKATAPVKAKDLDPKKVVKGGARFGPRI